MVRYLGPKHIKLKTLGNLPGLKILQNKQKRASKPNVLKKFPKKSSAYCLRLKEKQKIRYNYGISETQLYHYVKKLQYLRNKTQNDLLTLIEFRLDIIVYTLGFTKTIASARQLINHGKILVNSLRVTIASFICKKKDIILLNLLEKQKEFYRLPNLSLFELPNHLLKLNSFCGQIIENKIITFNLIIDERLVFEFYSKC